MLGLYPCCLSKQGKCFWDYSRLIKMRTEFCSAYEKGHTRPLLLKVFSVKVVCGTAVAG